MRIPWLAGCLLLLALPSFAQELPPLTLEQARDLAAEHNPTYRQALNSVVSAEATARESSASFFPSLNLSLGSNGGRSRRFTAEDDFGKPVESERAVESSSSSTSQSLSMSVQLFDGGSRYRRLRAARASRDAAVAAVASAASMMELDLSTRYYEAQRTADLIALEERLLQAAEGRYTATEELIRVAGASPVDLLGAEIDVARRRQAVESARGMASKAMLALVEQIGVEGAEGWELVTELPEIFDPASLDADVLVARAHEVSPVLHQSAAQLRAAEQQRRAAGAGRWPTVSLSSGFNRGISTAGYGALFDPDARNQSFNFGVSVSVPLFSQYQTTQQITQARVAALNAGETARRTTLQLEREVRGALIDLASAYRTVQLADLEAELALRRLSIASEQFRLGSMNFLNLQTIIDAAAQAERSALDARYSFATAVALLEQKIGDEL